MANIKVSVIVPVYNVENYLRRCLDSLVNQTLQDIEILVVNDGSTDNSQQIIDEFSASYPDKIHAFVKENGGLSDARNYALPYAEGEYIAFVDSDDYVDITMYEKMYNKAISENSEIVVCGFFKVNDVKNTMKSGQIGNLNLYNASPKDNKELIELNAPYAWNKLFKKDLFDRTKLTFPKGYIYEDICTVYPLLASASKISKCDEELYYYIIEREGSITATFNGSRVKLVDSLRLLDERFVSLGLFDEFRDQLVVINLRHIYFRFTEFDKYKDRKNQLQLVNKAFNLLDRYFRNWRRNSGSYIYFTLPSDRNAKRWFFKRRLYWIMVALMPLKWIVNYRERDYKRHHPAPHYKNYYTKCYEKKRIVKNRVLIESFHGKNISDSPYYIMKELLERGGYEIYVTSSKADWNKNKAFIKKNKLKVKLLLLESEKYYKILATAKYLVNNVSFPLCFIKRKNQVYINTWHGTPLKTLGKNMKKGIESMFNIQHNFLQSSYLLFPNDYTKDCMMEDYNLTKLFTYKTIVEGYPRNTVFSDKEAGVELKQNLGYGDKSIYAYMPTWRGANSYGNMGIYDINDILSRMDNALNENQILFVNLHPNVKNELDISHYKHIMAFPEEVPSYEFINCVDALITDYSSVFFDYSITKKPIVLFMYDYDDYMAERGMYFDVKTLPFKQVFDIDEMCSILETNEILNFSYDHAQEYIDKFIKYDSIDSTKKIVDVVFGGDESVCKIEDYASNREKKWKICTQLSRIDSKEESDKFFYGQDPDDTIFVINKKYFHALTNKWFFEEYNDKLTYVIYGYCRLLNEKDDKIFEDTENPNRVEKVRLAKRRAYRRTLPNLKIVNRKSNRRII